MILFVMLMLVLLAVLVALNVWAVKATVRYLRDRRWR